MPKVKVGNDNRDGVAGQNTYSAHVGGGSIELRLRGRPVHRHRRRRRPVRRGRQRLRAARPALPAALRRAQHGGEHERPARQGPAHPAAGRTPPARPASAPPTRSRRATCSPPGTEKHEARDLRDGLPQPVHGRRPTRRARARSWSASTAPTRRPTARRAARPASSSGTASPSPASTAGRCARATTRPPTATSATRSRAARPARASTARRRRSPTSRRTTPACRASPARPSAPTSGTSARATIPRASRSRPARARRSRSPGPIYHYDAANPSDTKWPAYYDGAWLILDRAQNWWRETRVQRRRLRRCCASTACSGRASSASPSHTYPIPVKFGPDGSLYLATWGYDCCRAQLPDEPAGPADAGRLHRRRGGHHRAGGRRDRRPAPATAPASTSAARRSTLNASDSSGVARIEYSLDGGASGRATPRPSRFTTRGTYTVRYRATDRANNTSEIQQVDVHGRRGRRLPAGAVGRVQRRAGHRAAGATATRRRRRPARARRASPDGSLVLPLGAYSVDLTRTGPIGVPRPAAPDRATSRWSRRSRRPGWTPTSAAQGSAYAQVGLKIFQTNDNWIKVAHTRNADGNPTGSANTYFELATRPTARARSARARAWRAPATCRPGGCAWSAAARTITAAYSLTDPDGAGANWVGARHGRTSTRSCRRPTARATSAPTAATARSRPATTTSGSRRTRRSTPPRR